MVLVTEFLFGASLRQGTSLIGIFTIILGPVLYLIVDYFEPDLDVISISASGFFILTGIMLLITSLTRSKIQGWVSLFLLTLVALWITFLGLDFAEFIDPKFLDGSEGLGSVLFAQTRSPFNNIVQRKAVYEPRSFRQPPKDSHLSDEVIDTISTKIANKIIFDLEHGQTVPSPNLINKITLEKEKELKDKEIHDTKLFSSLIDTYSTLPSSDHIPHRMTFKDLSNAADELQLCEESDGTVDPECTDVDILVERENESETAIDLLNTQRYLLPHQEDQDEIKNAHSNSSVINVPVKHHNIFKTEEDESQLDILHSSEHNDYIDGMNQVVQLTSNLKRNNKPAPLNMGTNVMTDYDKTVVNELKQIATFAQIRSLQLSLPSSSHLSSFVHLRSKRSDVESALQDIEDDESGGHRKSKNKETKKKGKKNKTTDDDGNHNSDDDEHNSNKKSKSSKKHIKKSSNKSSKEDDDFHDEDFDSSEDHFSSEAEEDSKSEVEVPITSTTTEEPPALMNTRVFVKDLPPEINFVSEETEFEIVATSKIVKHSAKMPTSILLFFTALSYGYFCFCLFSWVVSGMKDMQELTAQADNWGAMSDHTESDE